MPVIPSPFGPVEITRDGLGYPRLRVKDAVAGAWARGYVHATDRLIQTQLTLHASRGRMMELLGDHPAARLIDRATRHLDLGRGLAGHERALAPATRRVVEAYCAGFEAGRRSRPWPLVLRALGIHRRVLQVSDVLCLYRLAGYLGLTSLQHTAEALVAELVIRGASQEGLETLLGDAVAGLERDDLRNVQVREAQAYMTLPLQQGSNAFAVSARQSKTGHALLMSEWHLEVGRFPPIVYAVHVEYPTGFVQGLTMPGLPFVSSGRTDKVAWGYTYGHADHVDFVVERCRNGRIEANGRTLPLKRRVERVRVRGRGEEQWEFWDAPHGTIHGDADRDSDHLLLRWSGLHELTAGDFDAANGLTDAESTEQFCERHRNLRTHSFGMIVADTQGVIAHMHSGQMDDRPKGWTGGYPRRGWDLDGRVLPSLPEKLRPYEIGLDVAVAANQEARSKDGRLWTTLAEPAYRRDTIASHLATDGATLRTLVAASYDRHDGCAAHLLDAWSSYLPETAAPLVAWGQAQTENRAENLRLFYALHHEAGRALLARHLGKDLADEIADTLQVLPAFQPQIDAVLAGTKPHLLDEHGLAEVLGQAWPRALERAPRTEMPVRRAFKNALFQGWLPQPLGFDSGEVEFPGSPCAPFQARTLSFRGFEMVVGPSFHYCTDLGDRGGWYHVPGGASEQRLGPGYGKGVDDWRLGRFHPIGDPSGAPPDHG